MRKAWAYILPVILCFLVGALAGWLQNDSIVNWYPFLAKPALTPPNVVFPIAWGIIYLCMGLSAGRVLTVLSGARNAVMQLWFAQLILNFLWSIFFFYFRSPLLGLIDIAVLDVLVILYVVHSARIRPSAAWLFVPYLCWVCFATYLNAWILAVNGSGI